MIFDDRPEKSADTRETSQIWLRIIWGVCAAVCLIGVLFWLARRHAANQVEGPSTVVKASSEDSDDGQGHFELGEDLLKNMDGVEVDVAADRIVFHLQKWADAQHAAEDWIADPLFNGLPKRLGLAGQQNLLSRLTFETSDVYMLREAFWLRDLSRRVAHEGTLDDADERWLQASEAELGREVVQQLRVVLRLFDWVVRNIQLEPDALGKASESSEQPFPDGADRTSWEALLMGRGHAWVRSQILILLARQQHMDVVMLGLDRPSAGKTEGGEFAAEPLPWTSAAFLGGRLFLLDTRLGLPIPANDDGTGVATLEAVLSHPERLRQLDVEGEDYPMNATDLQSLVALIHATPHYLSQRMKLMEPRLSGDFKTVLTTEPSRLRQSLLKHEGIQRVALWSLPYDALRFQSLMTGNAELVVQRASLMYVFEGDRPLGLGRRRYFQGVLNDDPPKTGAKSYFLNCRISDQELPRVAAQEVIEMLNRAGFKLEEVPEDQLRALQQEAFNRLMRAKRAATYWLALLNFEEGKYQVALDFLEKRVLTVDKGSWLQGAQYNLGRTYQRLAEAGQASARAKAREHYLADRDSPQYAGNWIRARRVEMRVGGAVGESKEPNPEEPTATSAGDPPASE